jgi:predicted amidohydrolase YtcJ
MSRRLIAVFALLFLAIAYFSRGSANVLYIGGPVLTMDPDNRVVDALYTEGDRIVAVGNAAQVRQLAASGARVVNLEGRALMPGFIDAHSHFPGSGLFAVISDLNSPPIGAVRSIEDVVAGLRERGKQTGAGKWVVGMGYDDSLLAEKRHPTRADLDRVATDRPVTAIHVSGHLAAVNSEGLKQLGYTRGTPDPANGRVRRDANGEPDGVLEEGPAERVMKLVIQPGAWDAIRIVRRANTDYLSAGVTTAQNGYARESDMVAVARASRFGITPLRTILWPSYEVADHLLDGSFTFATRDPLWVRQGAVKIQADGSIQGYTANLREPYFKPPGDDPSFRGYARMKKEELMERVVRYHRAGLQVAVHGNGDAAIDDVLDAFAAAQQAQPRPDARHIIVHAQMARDDQLDRMKTLGVIPSFFVLHTYYWADRHRDIFLGPERTARISPTRGAVDRGLRFTLHADTPVVPMNPLRIVWSAVNRRSTSGAVVGPEQRIDTMRALRAVTIDAAFQHFEENEKGSLEPGKLADLVILDRSPLDDPEHIDEIRVLDTIIGGRSVYQLPAN